MVHAIHSTIDLISSHSPAIFEPLSLRGRNSFRHLGSHFFQVFEKVWLCNKIILNTTSTRLRERNLEVYCTRYSLPKHVIREWVLESLLEIDMTPSLCLLDESPVDATGLSNIVAFSSLLNRSQSSDEYRIRRLSLRIEEEMIATSSRRLVARALDLSESSRNVRKRKNEKRH